MSAITLESILIPSAVSMIGAYQLTTFAGRVGGARRRLKVDYPKMTGNGEFERYARAQQNSLEFFSIFLVVLWTCSLFFHPIMGGLLGIYYINGRRSYFNGYIKAVEDRIPGFMSTVKALQLMLLFSIIGMVALAVKRHQGFDLFQYGRHFAEPHLKKYNLEFLLQY
ncbi:Microsomal glutathione S-transferase 2 [Trichoplax sp. H2]|uniref:Microsomal glutathione S-transferase 2 n=1 Tax=Trichoplax adhaerens TaxID=10228 RepID=B3RP01_TRIAD|nr:hypothetical protein TRIADDRAFT_53353 [Trichoplax adhaerens]EDV28106.1 hypothetical protein TRIADDRAFT_53353 [Trichoplax adhaerens]RDD43424.1 Microsomal glutathione S-transferase 2 [Trichoplax sp. H2]|eukprot:XP_002109940.1 hypothetical protein TRIADDRAFT_53353 [Trichoplax adhaerens]